LEGNWVVSSLFAPVRENAGMPANYRFLMNYELQEKNGNLLTETYSLRNLYIIN
jgi:hypothetical protein